MSSLTFAAVGAIHRLVLFGAETPGAPDGFVPYASENEWSYVLVGWGLVIAGVAIYAALVVRRGRQLSKQLPPDERRWTS
jgi:hypothetical protein